MNATRIQINGRNAIALVLAVVIVALTAALLAAIPELVVARPSAASSEIAAEAAFLSANPELTLARGYVPPGGWTQRMPQNLKLHNKIDSDRDIGLLEFFTPQTKEVSTSCSDVVNPDRVALDRNYGTFTSAWTNCPPCWPRTQSCLWPAATRPAE